MRRTVVIIGSIVLLVGILTTVAIVSMRVPATPVSLQVISKTTNQFGSSVAIIRLTNETSRVAFYFGIDSQNPRYLFVMSTLRGFRTNAPFGYGLPSGIREHPIPPHGTVDFNAKWDVNWEPYALEINCAPYRLLDRVARKLPIAVRSKLGLNRHFYEVSTRLSQS